jgi:DNA primase
MAESDLVQLVRPYLQRIKISGSHELSALCPFPHGGKSDRNPSFSMSLKPENAGVFHCYSCKASGNLSMFLVRMKMSRADAEMLAKDVGASKRIGYKQVTTDERSFLPNSILGAYFRCPTELLEVGFSMSLLEEYEIGLDEQNNRITFPLRDIEGRLIGISGRSLDPDDMPRYLLYGSNEMTGFPGYVIPRKDFIWNLHRVYARLRKGEKIKELIIAEGFKVCLWLIQHGFKNTVALTGSSLTRAQQKLLEGLELDFLLALDNDLAGVSGTRNIGKELTRFGKVTTVDPSLLDSKGVRQLDELDGDDLRPILEHPIPYSRFIQQRRPQEDAHERRY